MSIIKAENLTYEYINRDEEGNASGITTALSHVDLDIEAGQFITILGHNGSGKSTLAKHINALLTPAEGTVIVDGLDTSDYENIWEVRKTAGMVFQNPDNQIIGQIVEEDVGFGPENLGVPTAQIWERVEASLRAVGMYEFRKGSPNKLSGGQKQRVSIAGVLAMQPKCLILDEPTAMLDPMGRKEVIKAALRLNKEEKITVILITHFSDEAVFSDRVFITHKGSIALSGTPREVFSQTSALKNFNIDLPAVTKVSLLLREKGVFVPDGILNVNELANALMFRHKM